MGVKVLVVHVDAVVSVSLPFLIDVTNHLLSSLVQDLQYMYLPGILGGQTDGRTDGDMYKAYWADGRTETFIAPR